MMDATNQLSDTDEIEVEVTIRIGRTRLTVAELSALRSNEVLTLEQSIASLTYALEFVRTQDARDEKVRLLRPRQNEQVADTHYTQGGEAAMLG